MWVGLVGRVVVDRGELILQASLSGLKSSEGSVPYASIIVGLLARSYLLLNDESAEVGGQAN